MTDFARNFTQLSHLSAYLSKTAQEPLSHLGYWATLPSEAAVRPVEGRSRPEVGGKSPEAVAAPGASWDPAT